MDNNIYYITCSYYHVIHKILTSAFWARRGTVFGNIALTHKQESTLSLMMAKRFIFIKERI